MDDRPDQSIVLIPRTEKDNVLSWLLSLAALPRIIDNAADISVLHSHQNSHEDYTEVACCNPVAVHDSFCVDALWAHCVITWDFG